MVHREPSLAAAISKRSSPKACRQTFQKQNRIRRRAIVADFSGKGKDEFRTPYAYWGRRLRSRVEIHATATLNLLHGDWLTRLPAPLELALVLAWPPARASA